MFHRTTRRFIAHFFRAYPARSAILVVMLVMAGLAEAVGVASLLPLLDALGDQEGSGALPAEWIKGLLTTLNITPSLTSLLILVVLAMVIKALFRLLAMQQVGFTVAHVATDLRLNLLRALIATSWPYFVGQPTGRFANAVGTEASRAAQAYRGACSLAAVGIQALVYATIAFFVSWRIAIVAILVGVLLVWALSRAVQMGREAGARQTEALRELANRLTEALAGIKAIKAMGREEQLQPLLEHEAESLNRAQVKQVVAAEFLHSAQEPILVIFLAAGIYVGVAVLGMPLGYVLMLGFLFYRLAGRISLMQVEYQNVVFGETGFESLIEATRSAEAAREGTQGKTLPVFERQIAFDNVSFSYGDHSILERAHLTINRGEFLTLIGASGSGKTTAIDLLIGFYKPSDGRIVIDDVDLSDIDLLAWRRYVGYVPQETFIFHDSVRENVTLGDRTLDDAEVYRALELAGAGEFVSEMGGLDANLGERGGRLSGGQQQRIGIARALVRRPMLLILDEVTSALDPVTEAAICETIRWLPEDATILAVSHRPAFVEAAERVVRLENGKLTEMPMLVGDRSTPVAQRN